MSGVLDRMAKRALGALPTVQPLTAPHYAPPARGLRENLLELETSLELPPPEPQMESRRPGNPQTQGDAAPNTREWLRDFEQRVSQAPEAPPRPARAQNWPSPDRAQTGTPPSVQRAQPGPRTAPAGKGEPAREPKADDAGVVRPNTSPTRDAHPSPGRNLLLRLDDADDAAAPEPPAPRQRQPSVKETPAGPGRDWQSIRTSPPSRESAAPVEPKTEVHISIGSIELRAPRTEAKPAAPFRPKVTLEDFLRRNREGGA
jgi:hypothetical protein